MARAQAVFHPAFRTGRTGHILLGVKVATASLNPAFIPRFCTMSEGLDNTAYGIGPVEITAGATNNFYPLHHLWWKKLPGGTAGSGGAKAHTIHQEYSGFTAGTPGENADVLTKRTIAGNVQTRLAHQQLLKCLGLQALDIFVINYSDRGVTLAPGLRAERSRYNNGIKGSNGILLIGQCVGNWQENEG